MTSDHQKFSNYMSNPKAFTLKKWLAELLKEGYMSHDSLCERVSTSLTTQQDLEDFGKLLTSVFECGYKKAVKDYQEHAEKLGFKIKIIPQ